MSRCDAKPTDMSSSAGSKSSEYASSSVDSSNNTIRFKDVKNVVPGIETTQPSECVPSDAANSEDTLTQHSE